MPEPKLPPDSTRPSAVGRGIAASGALVLAAVVAWFAASLYRAPDVVPATADHGVFSAERAFRHVEVIAARPHPVGSPENAAVASYLIDELRRLGLEPQIQEADVVRRAGAPPKHVRNIVARRPGTGNSRAVLLSAHYDSVAAGPGAGDNASAVAALLETVRALNAGAPLRNDLIILLPDAEEGGLLGARAFLAEHPWRGDAGVVFNFDARGSRGPVLMYEASAGHGRLVQEFLRAVEPVFASSLAAFVYRHMQNGSDFTVFLRHGLAGLNFAFIEGVENYHKPSDTPANLDRRTLQHDGVIALGLARHFGHLELPLPRTGDRVYFNLLGPRLVHYPVSWVLPGALLLAAGTGVVLWQGRRSGRLRLGRICWAPGVWLLGLALVGALVIWILPPVSRMLGPRRFELPIALASAGLIFFGGHRLLRRFLHSFEVAAATGLLWTVGSFILAVWLPEGSYLFFWPATALWGALAVELRTPSLLARAVPLWIAALLFGPLLFLLSLAFPFLAAVAVVPGALLLPLALVAVDAVMPASWTSEGRRTASTS